MKTMTRYRENINHFIRSFDHTPSVVVNMRVLYSKVLVSNLSVHTQVTIQALGSFILSLPAHSQIALNKPHPLTTPQYYKFTHIHSVGKSINMTIFCSTLSRI